MILNFFVHFFVLLTEIKVKKKNRDWNILKISGILLVFLLATSTARLELQVIGFTSYKLSDLPNTDPICELPHKLRLKYSC